MADLALYRRGKEAAVDLVSPLDDGALQQTCSACPAWSIRDVVAHHVHFLGATVSHAVPPSVFEALVGADESIRERAGSERDVWTEAGVEARRHWPFVEVLTEWDRVVEMMSEDHASTALDLTMHLGDIGETLGVRTDPPGSHRRCPRGLLPLLPRAATGTGR